MSILNYLIWLLSSSITLAIMCLLFVILNIMDGFSTWMVLRPDHYERERNPIARAFFRFFKLPAAIVLFKAVLLSGMGVFISYYHNEALTINIALLIGNLLFCFVVRHNFHVYRKYRDLQLFYDRIKYVKVNSV